VNPETGLMTIEHEPGGIRIVWTQNG